MSTKEKIPGILIAIAIFLVGVCAFVVSADTHVPSTTRMNTVVGNVSNRLGHVSSISVGGSFAGRSTTTHVIITNNYTGVSGAKPAIQGTTTRGNSPGVSGTGLNTGIQGYGTGAGGSRGVVGESATGYGVLGQGGLYGGYFSGGGGLYGSTVVSGDGKFNGYAPLNRVIFSNASGFAATAQLATPFNTFNVLTHYPPARTLVLWIVGDSMANGYQHADAYHTSWPYKMITDPKFGPFSTIDYYYPPVRIGVYSGYTSIMHIKQSVTGKGAKIKVYNASVAGACLYNYTGVNYNKFLNTTSCDGIIFSIGKNQESTTPATQLAVYDNLLAKVKAKGFSPELLFTAQASTNPLQANTAYYRYGDVAAGNAAMKYGGGFYDICRDIAVVDPTYLWTYNNWVHLNEAGDAFIAKRMLSFFQTTTTPAQQIPNATATTPGFLPKMPSGTRTQAMTPLGNWSTVQSPISTRNRGTAEVTFGSMSTTGGFYGTFMGAHAIPSGATIPSSPLTNQLFILTNAGSRKWMLWYDGSAWIPAESSGASVLYVDSVNGTDDVNHGYGSGTSAYRTLTYMHSQVPPMLYGSVTVNAVGAFREKVVLAGKHFATSGCTYTLTGAWATLLTDTNATSAAARSSATAPATITNSGASWSINAYQGKMLSITSGTGAGQCLPILSNTATTISVEAWQVGYAVPDSTSHFVVYDWATKISGGDNDSTAVRDTCVEVGMNNVTVQNLNLVLPTTNGVLGDVGTASLIVQNCNISAVSNSWGYGLQLLSCISPIVQCNRINNCLQAVRMLGCVNAGVYDNWITSGYGVFENNQACALIWGNRLDACPSYGIWLGGAASTASTVGSHTQFSNSFVSCGTGISVNVANKCLVTDAAGQYYSSCTINYANATIGAVTLPNNITPIALDPTTGNIFNLMSAVGASVQLNMSSSVVCPTGTIITINTYYNNGYHTIFGTGFKTAGDAIPTPGSYVPVQFVYDGTYWRETTGARTSVPQ